MLTLCRLMEESTEIKCAELILATHKVGKGPAIEKQLLLRPTFFAASMKEVILSRYKYEGSYNLSWCRRGVRVAVLRNIG